jgi:hypothetical protein
MRIRGNTHMFITLAAMMGHRPAPAPRVVPFHGDTLLEKESKVCQEGYWGSCSLSRFVE